MTAVTVGMIGWVGMAAAPVEERTLQPGEAISFTFGGSDFYIPRPVEASDQVGVERYVGGYDLAANGYAFLIGETCNVTDTSTNGESVHLNNYGVIRTNGDSATLTNTEGESGAVRIGPDKRLTLGPTVNLYNVMLPDDDGKVATSVDYSITVTCIGEDEPEETTTTQDTTTTTEATSSTSQPTTSTTLPPTTTTSEPSTTTSTLPTTTTTGGTTSSTSSTTSSSTTVPPSTSTTNPETTTTTGGGTTSTTTPESTSSTDTTVPPTETTGTIPFTGFPIENMGLVVLMAAGAVLLGGGVLLAGKEGR